MGHICPPGSGSASTDLIESGSGSETLHVTVPVLYSKVLCPQLPSAPKKYVLLYLAANLVDDNVPGVGWPAGAHQGGQDGVRHEHIRLTFKQYLPLKWTKNACYRSDENTLYYLFIYDRVRYRTTVSTIPKIFFPYAALNQATVVSLFSI